MNRVTQMAKISEYLSTHNTATLRELTEACNVNWPARRISELRDAGVNILDFWCDGVDADGNKVRYKRYYLKKVG